jgi:hypothetical protein
LAGAIALAPMLGRFGAVRWVAPPRTISGSVGAVASP